MHRIALPLALSLASLWATYVAGADVTLDLQPNRVLNQIDENVYGHFLEHIFHSVNGGLWGELIWNRSFEENSAGQWRIDDDCIVQQGRAVDQRLIFGDADWGDYEYTLEACKIGGDEGFLILFRVKNDKDFYWCNLGGWHNVRHSLERGRTGEERWHAVGPQVEGQITPDHWYTIRVRVEGSKIQVWLDGKLLIDFDDPAGHRTGKVGVGTWATQAKFRKLKVTSLDGHPLFEGLPESLAAPSVARHWDSIGDGIAYLDVTDPLNSRFSQKIVGRGGLAGIEQTGLAVRKGETYQGSLWTRGSASGGLTVRLVDLTSTLAEQDLPRPVDQWQEYPFRLTPSADSPNATLQVLLKGGGTVNVDQVSLMPASWMAAGGFRPDLLQAVADLRPPVIRWPGGCFASAYRWKDGIGPQHKRGVYPRLIWDDLDVNSFGTDEFVAMCRKVGAEPLIVVNIGTKSWNGEVPRETFLREACDWIEYCNGSADSKWGKVRAANGHPEPYHVKYWEIDNETWHMGVEEYADAVRLFAPAMTNVDPSIKLAACGSGGRRDDERGLQWNRVLIDRTADLIDYLSIHHYENPDKFNFGPVAYEEFFGKTAELIARSKNPDLQIYVSEWNAQSTDWRTGLYCGGLLNAFERSGEVLTLGGPALFLRHTSAKAWDNAFINFDQQRWFPAPNYVVMKLWRDHYLPQRVGLDGEAGPLNVVATRSNEGRTVVVKVVNPSKNAVPITLNLPEQFTPKAARMELVAPGSLAARNTIDSPQSVVAIPGRVTIDDSSVRFQLPAIAAAVVTLDVPKTASH